MPAPMPAPAPMPMPTPASQALLTVLLVEDNPADARLVQLMLADAHVPRFALVPVDRLTIAVETLVSGRQIDAILLDLGLPDGQGLANVTRLRGVAPRVPIIIMSGNDDEAVAVAGVRDGAQDYLVKGRIEADGLTRALRYAIERQEVETRLAAALETQQEANRQLARLSKAKSDFVSIVGHEFRTPLTGILGFSEIMRDEELSPAEVRDYAGDINADAGRLIRMITEMLDLDRMEAGQVTLRREMVDLRALVTEVAALARRTAPRHAILLALDDAVPPLLGDRDKLVQVVTNLVSNAIKYSAGGTITIGAAGYATSVDGVDGGDGGDGGGVHLSVCDEGVGIAPEALDTVFERYARIESAATRYIAGTGLGLPIVRQLVALHGGRVWAESVPGQGSTFHVDIPAPAPETDTAPETATAPPPAFVE